jgi:hypothetical protein
MPIKQPYASLGAAQTFTAAQRGAVVTLTSSSNSIASDFAEGNNFEHTTTENTTLANPSNLVAGQSGVITFTQDAVTPRTLAFGSYWKFPNGSAPSLTAVASAVDSLSYYVRDATHIDALMLNNQS